MSLSGKLQLMMAMYGMFAMDNSVDNKTNHIDSDQLRDRIREMKQKQIIQKGCKRFYFGEVEIIALNQKNADKKYKRYLKLKKEANE